MNEATTEERRINQPKILYFERNGEKEMGRQLLEHALITEN
jgi:hypothetical protein